MPMQTYQESRLLGIDKLLDNLKSDHDRAIEYLELGQGSRRGCLSNLSAYAQTRSLLAWFADHDLQAFKQWAYVAAKLERMICQIEPARRFPAYTHLYALLSDHPDMVNWFRQQTVSYFLEGEEKDRDNPERTAFHGYQALLALNGEWELLAERCEQILAMEIKKDKRFLIDHQFYLALANGDKSGMERVVNELTSPKVARRRNFEPPFAFTERLIGTHATIYAKIAWRHGYEIEVDSPWVPRQWLPIRPCDRYVDPWNFMQRFDIYQAFEEPWDEWSPVAGDRQLIR